MSRPDGGPAFPQRKEFGEFFVGLSLRDYFAAKALAALLPLVANATLTTKDGSSFTEAHIAEQAYAFADAMLAERGKL